MMRVLVAEDNPGLSELLQLAIEMHGAKADRAETGDEALANYHQAIYDREPYDLLLLDIALPWKTGVTVAEEIREIDPDTRICFITGVPDTEDLQQPVTRLNAAVIQKPFDVSEVIRQLGDRRKEEG